LLPCRYQLALPRRPAAPRLIDMPPPPVAMPADTSRHDFRAAVLRVEMPAAPPHAAMLSLLC